MSTASGFMGRRFRVRSVATTSARVASHTSRKPPTPCTATMPPAAIVRTQAASASAAGASAPPCMSLKASRGPQSGHEMSCAWKRRSAGSAYSRAQAAQSGNAAIVVAGRSNGSAAVIACRGPQALQAMCA